MIRNNFLKIAPIILVIVASLLIVSTSAREQTIQRDSKAVLSGSSRLQLEIICTHDRIKYTDNKDGTHSKICIECNDELGNENHIDIDLDNRCDKCGAELSCIHEHIEYIDNKDGTHTKICLDCKTELEEKEEHLDLTHACICDKCGAQLEHKDKDNNLECDNCGEKLPCNHNDTKYIDNKNGTHDKVCSDCNKVLVDDEKHIGKDKCELCGAKIDNGNTGENPGVDPTPSPTPLPTPSPTPNPSKPGPGGGDYWFPVNLGGNTGNTGNNKDDTVDITDDDTPKGDTFVFDKVNHIAYIKGYSDGRVGPEDNLTRAQMVQILYRLMDEDFRDFCYSATNDYKDTTGEEWFNEALSTISNADIVHGYSDGTFRPNNNITRAEFATMIANMFSVPEIKDSGLTDISGHWAENNINKVVTIGWMAGYPNKTFKPDAYITRAEAVHVMNKILDRDTITKESFIKGMKEWPDNNKDAWYYLDIQEATNEHLYDVKDGKEIWTSIIK